ncbi:MAG: DUF5362 family protein [Chloroherpetonaceae bacterium]|nr:DUF5362 family protein [Chloroherpetonaceae bacterium]
MFRNLKIEVETVALMKESARWTKYFTIIQFTIIALLSILGFGMILGGLFISSAPNLPKGFDAIGPIYFAAGIVYLIYGGVILIPVMNLSRFSDKIDKSLNLGDQSLFEQSIDHLSKYFKYIVLMILISIPVTIVLFIIMTVIMVNAGIAK